MYIENTSNKEMLDHLTKIGKLNNIKFYYLNNSLDKNIFAVHILPEGEDLFTNTEAYNNEHDFESILAIQRRIS